MSGEDPRGQFLYNLPPSVLSEFCRVMDGLSDIVWTRFASGVLRDQTQVRLAERVERRTDWVMNQWESRNGRVGELVELLESLELLRARDIVLDWVSSVNRPCPAPPSLSKFDPPPKPAEAPPTVYYSVNKEGGGPLPGPAPPPDDLISKDQQPPQEVRPDDAMPPLPQAAVSYSSAIMCWSYEEVYAGTQGFSPALQIGEGGFGVVYRATLCDIDCAIKRLRQDCMMDWCLLKRSFQTEIENLSKFRHDNIVDLLGFSEGEASMCLVYRFMENRSLEDQLHNECVMPWPLRISVVKGAAAALQYLHCPPKSQEPLIHGDVKSSNILLDQHLVAKLSDFGLARYVPKPKRDVSATRTASVGKTTTIRGTLAYLPEEYMRKGELSTALDVYSFGVVLLEVLTGRRALEKDKQSEERFLKDLVVDVGSTPEAWRRQVDRRLMEGGAPEPTGYNEVATLACRSLSRKNRPAMKEVLSGLQNIDSVVRKTNCSHSSLQHNPHFPSFPRPPCCLDSNVEAVSEQLSRLGPLEQTCQPSQISSSSSSSSFCALTPPHPLNSSSLAPLSSSFVGPCETDESRGFSQYDLQCRSNGTRSRDQCQSPAPQSKCSQPSVPTEDQYNFPLQPNRTSYSYEPRFFTGATGTSPTGPDNRTTAGLNEFSPARSLQSTSPKPSVLVNPSKQRLLDKKTEYEQGRIGTPQLLSSDDIYGDSVDIRVPEESDDLDYLPAKHT